MFVDTVEISLLAGKGGDGIISWRREKFVPKGGPAGGDGGDGGSVIIEADPQLRSLESLRNIRILKAASGQPGGGNNRTGKRGADLYVKVPLGTLLKDQQSQTILCDFTEPGQVFKICQGGKGGKGNTRFKTATRQTPYLCTPGTKGEEAQVELELKLIADVGLVGMPNAGKSTLISKLSHREVKIAPYPFTTLRPNIGVMQCGHAGKLLIADIPGLIENASEDRGLGFSFLKHIQRCSTLIYLIELAPYQERDPFEEFLMLQRELKAYDATLLEKPFLVVLNKIDQEGAEELKDAFYQRFPLSKDLLLVISAREELHLPILKKEIENLHLKEKKLREDALQNASVEQAILSEVSLPLR